VSDKITIDRAVFLNLIAAAEMARAWMAHYAPSDNWANNVRVALNHALPEAVAEKPTEHETKNHNR
jgi:hypothetical protein